MCSSLRGCGLFLSDPEQVCRRHGERGKQEIVPLFCFCFWSRRTPGYITILNQAAFAATIPLQRSGHINVTTTGPRLNPARITFLYAGHPLKQQGHGPRLPVPSCWGCFYEERECSWRLSCIARDDNPITPFYLEVVVLYQYKYWR